MEIYQHNPGGGVLNHSMDYIIYGTLFIKQYYFNKF